MTVELPDGWREVALNTVVRSKSGNSNIIKGKNASRPEAGLFQGYSATGPDVWVKQASHSGIGIVVSAVGARCGKTFLASGEWTAIANTHVLLPLDGMYPKFLWYVSNREDWWVKSGTAQPFVKVKDTLERPFPLPPHLEQERIVEILEEQFSRLDSALASVKTVREKAQAFRRSLLHAAFSGELTGGTETWRETLLGQCVELLGGYAFKSDWYEPEGIKLARGQNIAHGVLDWSDTRNISIERSDEFQRFSLEVGDLLLALDRPLISTGLKWAVVEERDLPALLLQRVAKINGRAGEVTQTFVQFWLQSDYLTAAINPGRSIGVPHISLKELEGLQINLPPLATQERIVEILEEQFSRLDNALEVANQLEARIAAERRSLLHSAFTGELTAKWRATHV